MCNKDKETEYKLLTDSEKFWLNFLIGVISIGIMLFIPFSAKIEGINIFFKIFIFASSLLFIQFNRIRNSASDCVIRITRLVAMIFRGTLLMSLFLNCMKWGLLSILSISASIWTISISEPIRFIGIVIGVFLTGLITETISKKILSWLSKIIEKAVSYVSKRKKNSSKYVYIAYELALPFLLYFIPFFALPIFDELIYGINYR